MASDNEESGSATGWTIANATQWANQDTPGAGMTWTTDSTARIAIRVNGSTAQTAPSAASAPTGLTITPGNAQLSVSWMAPSGSALPPGRVGPGPSLAGPPQAGY